MGKESNLREKYKKKCMGGKKFEPILGVGFNYALMLPMFDNLNYKKQSGKNDEGIPVHHLSCQRHFE